MPNRSREKALPYAARSRTKTMRRALGLTQEAFAMRYHISLGTLRDWEQGRSEPDQTARAYLTVTTRKMRPAHLKMDAKFDNAILW